MSDINHLIHTNAMLAFRQGVTTERLRAINKLKPYAQHDEEMCFDEGKQICYPEDCSASIYQHAIQEIIEEEVQENIE